MSRLKLFLMCLAMLLPGPVRPVQAQEAKMVATPARRGFVYEVTKGKVRFFLAGSLHRLTAAQHPPPWPYEYAFRQATRLVFEVDPDENSSVAASAALSRQALFTGRDSLEKHLKPEVWQRFSRFCEPRGLNPKDFRQYKPWYIASWISDFEYDRLGIQQRLGLDHYYHYRAGLMRKATSGLERPSELIAASSSGTSSEHEDNLMDTMDSIAGLRSFFDRLASAWAAGNEAATLAVLCPTGTKESELWKRVVQQRSRAWLPRLTKPDKTGDLPLYFVGAGHLVGETGLCTMLRQAGYQVRQLEAGVGR